jgi:cytochrome c-type biogenesis protein CcmI
VCENLFMILFLIVSLIISACTFIALAIGIKRSVQMHTTSSNERLAVFKDRKREIEADQDAGRISAEDANQAIDDLSVQLEREAQDLVSGSKASSASSASPELATATTISWPWAAGLLSLGCLISLAAYTYLGAPELTEPSFRAAFEKAQSGETAAPAKTPTTDELLQTIENLKKLSVDKPNDPSVWGSLGRAYRMANKPTESAQAYSQAKALGLNSPDFLVDYAEAIAFSKQGDFSGLPLELLTKALEQNPDLPKGIALMGAAQFRLGNFVEAKKYLQKTLAALPPGSEQAKAVQGAIDQISTAAAPSGEKKAGPTIRATISMSPEILEKIKGSNLSQASLFVAIRSPLQPMPIAAKKIDWASVSGKLQKGESIEVVLDSSNLLARGAFDEKQELIVVARLSPQGNATKTGGDVTGTSTTFKLETNKAITLRIDQVNQ